MTCSTQTAVTNTHSHPVLPATRTEVSSEATTADAVTWVAIAVAAATSGIWARARMLLIAPSLMDKPNTSPISIRSRSKPIAWA